MRCRGRSSSRASARSRPCRGTRAPPWRAASRRWRIAGVAATPLVLATSYAALPRELDPALASRPDAILMIGVAGRSRRVRIEWRGTARRSTLFPDAAGERAATPLPARAAPRLCAVAPAKMLRALSREAIPARLSRDAGRYLCNASYFRALGAGPPVVFIHIPTAAIPRPAGSRRARLPWNERLAAALAAIGAVLLSEARRDR